MNKNKKILKIVIDKVNLSNYNFINNLKKENSEKKRVT